MFKKILIANRGEIACRVMKTARRLGVATVAVYSDADADALHVEMADEALHIGPPQSAHSYLDIDKIVAACKQTGAEAVHPGYGFLSENTAFAEALAKAGVVFVGPNPRAIQAMGDKITSKRLAADAGVNTIPGYTDVVTDAGHAVKIAADVGYPVMLKASAGGGGKGMRIARDDAECRDGFERAANEARSSFGDDRIFIEKFIEQPRHIEIQIIADQHKNIVYLGERECSIQRRHQKVIEEAPSPFLDPATRGAMGEQAVALAAAVEYQSAGTVEFIVDAQKNFYFLEMNTRLQVEHPVTELVTGLDLVELMLRVAAGEKLPLTQDGVDLRGWAVECRVYAEDPYRDFLPSIGRLIRYRPPVESASVRVDTGVYEGGEVSMYYDPMIAKLITHGDNREEAIRRMQTALNEYYIRGVSHNISFLSSLMAHPRFRDGRLTTNFIAEEYADGFDAANLRHVDESVFVTAMAAIYARRKQRGARISGRMAGQQTAMDGLTRIIQLDGVQHHVHVVSVPHGFDVTFDGRVHRVSSDWHIGEPLFKGEINGTGVCVQIERSGARYRLQCGGAERHALVLTELGAELNRHMLEKAPPDLSGFLLSPMPGLLVRMSARVGDEIKQGEALAVIEAMKMENVLHAPRDVVIKELLVAEGDNLAVGEPIMAFE